MTKNIRRELVFPQSREDVWRALTNSAALTEWMMPNDFVARVGHRFTFRTQPNPQVGFDGIVHCEVLECVPPSRLVYSWAGGPVNTRVSYRLESDGDGTRVFFEQSGFEVDEAFRGAEFGWTYMHERLARVVTDMAANR